MLAAAVMLLLCHAAVLGRAASCQVREVDVIWVLDESLSVKAGPYEDLKKFIVNASDEFEFGPTRTRMGLIEFSAEPDLANNNEINDIFDLDQYLDKQAWVDAVNSIKFDARADGKAVGTFHLSTMQYLNEEYLVRNKARTGDLATTRIVILATDGQPHPGSSGIEQGGPALLDQVTKMMSNNDFGIDKFIFLKIGANVDETLFDGVEGYNSTTDRISVDGYDDLQKIVGEISTIVCIEQEEASDLNLEPLLWGGLGLLGLGVIVGTFFIDRSRAVNGRPTIMNTMRNTMGAIPRLTMRPTMSTSRPTMNMGRNTYAPKASMMSVAPEQSFDSGVRQSNASFASAASQSSFAYRPSEASFNV